MSSTALATTNTGAFLERQGYYGYGKYRTGGVLPTDNRYTGQKLDAATGLYYYGARYYDRNIGQFVSPDTLVPDPTNVWDYDRYAYGRLNPLKYNDPSGYNPVCMSVPLPQLALGCEIGMWVVENGPTAIQLATQWADKAPAMWDRVFNSSSAAEQASHSASQSNAGNSGTGDPNGLEPNRIPKGFENVEQFNRFSAKLNEGLAKAGYGDTQAAFQGSSVTGVKYTTGAPFDVGRTSDYDIALAGEKLMRAAQNIGIQVRGGGIRTGPLNDKQLEQLGLTKLADELSKLAGRPVNFMIYRSVDDAVNRGPSILVPK